MRCRLVGALVASLMVVFSQPGFAQGGRAEVTGTITDAAKAIMPGVTVTATNEGTGLARARRSPVLKAKHPVTAARHLHHHRRTLRVSVGSSHRRRAERWPGSDAQPPARDRGCRRESDRDRASAARGVDLEPHRHQRHEFEIDGLPSANRSQFSLMQTIPGMVPVLPGRFV